MYRNRWEAERDGAGKRKGREWEEWSWVCTRRRDREEGNSVWKLDVKKNYNKRLAVVAVVLTSVRAIARWTSRRER